MIRPNAYLQLHIEPDEPIAIYELTSSLNAIWRQYHIYVASDVELQKPHEAKLLVSSVSPGSIDISFIPDIPEALAAAAGALDHIKIVNDFAGHIKTLLNKFINNEKNSEPVSDVTVKDCDDAIAIVKPTAEHGGQQIFNSYNNSVMYQTIIVDPSSSRKIISEASRAKAALQYPDAEKRERVPLVWFRIDRSSAKQSGSSPDKGTINEIDPKPKSIFFTDDLSYLKKEMTEGEDHPFQKIYFVDVEVSRVDGKVVSYRVIGYHGSDELED